MTKRYLYGAAVVMALWAGATGARAQALPQGARVEKDVVYGTVGGKQLKLDVYLPAAGVAAKGAAIVRLGPVRETPTGAAVELLNQGYALVYPGYLPGEPRDRVFTQFPADLHAAKAAVRWVRGNSGKLGIDKERIAVWGAGREGAGATMAALVGMTAEQKELGGAIGDFVGESSAVRAVCLFEGITDWRNAELYGDETVNIPGTPAYQLFGSNAKEHPDDARQASAVNYVRPRSPATLMVTLASDEQRAMHLIFAETLKKAGVPSALYEVAGVGGVEGRGVDDARLSQTVVQFFADTLRPDRAQPAAMTVEQEVDQLVAAGLYKQARRLIDEQMGLGTGGDAAAGLTKREPWLKRLRQINDQQQEPALKQLLAAKKAGVGSIPDGTAAIPARTLWTIREVLTDPERIGQYNVEATAPQRVFENRADAMRFVETLNNYVVKGDTAKADAQAALLQDMARKGDSDLAILNEFLGRYREIKGRSSHVWPPGVRGGAFASDFGQDLYGYWMDLKAGGVTQRFRYIAPGRFTMGSSKDEWGRLPGEPILEPVQVGAGTRGFWLADSEVTQGMYEGVMGKEENRSAFGNAKGTVDVKAKLPVENTSYAHAVNFLNKLGVDARLPTEAEWEYACRAGSNFMYSGTGRLSDMGWFWDEARPQQSAPGAAPRAESDVRILYDLETDRTDMARLTHPVKQKLPNRWGLYDMQGNVWEWCSGTSPTKARDFHPARGGSWLSIPQSCRAARDVWLPVEQQAWNLGFRILIPAQ